MMPTKELTELVRALTQTSEYSEMMKVRKRIMENIQVARQMSAFEHEYGRISGLNISEPERAERLKRLYADYAALLNREEIKGFAAAVGQYQKMMAESLAYLSRQLDMSSQPRAY